MKQFSSTIKIRIENRIKTKPKVLLWTLWRSGTHWLADMLSDMMDVSAVYKSVDGNDYKKETIEQLNNYRRNTILIRHVCFTPKELFDLTDPLGFKVIFIYRYPRDVLASLVNMRKYVQGYRVNLPPFPDMSIDEILNWDFKNLLRVLFNYTTRMD